MRKNWKYEERKVFLDQFFYNQKVGLKGLDLISIHAKFPEKGGLVINIHAKKEANLSISQALLTIEGDQFWQVNCYYNFLII